MVPQLKQKQRNTNYLSISDHEQIKAIFYTNDTQINIVKGRVAKITVNYSNMSCLLLWLGASKIELYMTPGK